jgi:hypothetical protein
MRARSLRLLRIIRTLLNFTHVMQTALQFGDFLAKLAFGGELCSRQFADFCNFHDYASSFTRNLVLTGSLWAARRIASRAVSSDTLHFKHDGAGDGPWRRKILGCLYRCPFNVLRLAGNRSVRENADPDLTTTLDVAGHSLTGGFDLAAGNAFMALGLQRVIAVSNVVAAGSNAADLALAYLAELILFRE